MVFFLPTAELVDGRGPARRAGLRPGRVLGPLLDGDGRPAPLPEPALAFGVREGHEAIVPLRYGRPIKGIMGPSTRARPRGRGQGLAVLGGLGAPPAAATAAAKATRSWYHRLCRLRCWRAARAPGLGPTFMRRRRHFPAPAGGISPPHPGRLSSRSTDDPGGRALGQPPPAGSREPR